MDVQSCYFAYQTYCFLDLLVSVASLDLKVPNILGSFSNRTGTSVDDGARKLNNWLDQWQRMAEWQIGHQKSCLVLSARFPAVN